MKLTGYCTEITIGVCLYTQTFLTKYPYTFICTKSQTCPYCFFFYDKKFCMSSMYHPLLKLECYASFSSRNLLHNLTCTIKEYSLVMWQTLVIFTLTYMFLTINVLFGLSFSLFHPSILTYYYCLKYILTIANLLLRRSCLWKIIIWYLTYKLT